MKTYILLFIALILTGCVQSTTKPLVGVNQKLEVVSIINVYPDHFYTFEPGLTIFSNKLLEKNISGFNVSNIMENKIKGIFTSTRNIRIKNFGLNEKDLSDLVFDQKSESLIEYEKKIKNIPNVLEKARDQDIDKLLLIAPSTVNLPDTRIFTPSSGLWYFLNGKIESYSSVNIYFIDTKSNEVLGKHRLSNYGNLVRIENVLSETEIKDITLEDEKERQYTQNDGAGVVLALEYKLAYACARMSRFDSYSMKNLGIIKDSITNSIDILLSRLENIYLGTPLKKRQNWRATWSLSSPLSCEI